MKRKKTLVSLAMLAVLFSACSLPPTRPVTKEQLFHTQIYNAFIIKESPESVLNALNREGEVVLEAKQRDLPVYIKIMATRTGLVYSILDR